MKLQEVLNKPVPHRWFIKSGRGWEGSFVVAGNEYEFSAQQDVELGPGMYEIVFVMHNKNDTGPEPEPYLDGKTKTGNEFAVFATVAKMMEEFMSAVKPGSIVFTAKEKSRQRLYIRFGQKLAKKYDMTFNTEHSSDGLEIRMYKRIHDKSMEGRKKRK
jgi:hypothetical protein